MNTSLQKPETITPTACSGLGGRGPAPGTLGRDRNGRPLWRVGAVWWAPWWMGLGGGVVRGKGWVGLLGCKKNSARKWFGWWAGGFDRSYFPLSPQSSALHLKLQWRGSSVVVRGRLIANYQTGPAVTGPGSKGWMGGPPARPRCCM